MPASRATRNWLWQIPVVGLFTLAFCLQGAGNRNPLLHRVSSYFHDLKLRLRGQLAPRNKIVIVGVDSHSIERYGRWPWHRDLSARLIEQVFEAGAKVVGVDIVYAEEDLRVPPGLTQRLEDLELGALASEFETDGTLEKTVSRHRDRLVMSWGADPVCRPDQDGPAHCRELHSLGITPSFEKFALQEVHAPGPVDPRRTQVPIALGLINNLERYNRVASHAGFFNRFPDEDGTSRRSALVMWAGGKAYPSISLEMARVGLDEKLALRLDEQGRASAIQLRRSGRSLAVDADGMGVFSFHTRGETPFVSAADVLDGILSGKPDLKDAYVVVGLTGYAIGHQTRFPMRGEVPTAEILATELDDILNGEFIAPCPAAACWGVLLLMTLGAGFFIRAVTRLALLPALGLLLATAAALVVADVLLIRRGLDAETGFLYLELLTLFALTHAAKYQEQAREMLFFARYIRRGLRQFLSKHRETVLGGGKVIVGRRVVLLKIDIVAHTETTFGMPYGMKRLFQDLWFTEVDRVVAERCFMDCPEGDGSFYYFEDEPGQRTATYVFEAVLRIYREAVPVFDRKFREGLDSLLAEAPEMARPVEAYLETYRKRTGKEFWDRRTQARFVILRGQIDEGLWGMSSRGHYTLQGDLNTLAARLEKLSDAEHLLVTPEFWDGILDEGHVPRLQPVWRVDQLKGIGPRRYGMVELQTLNETDPASPSRAA